MKIKILLIASFLAIASGCKTNSKNETITEEKTTVAPVKPTATLATPKLITIDAFNCKKNGEIRKLYIEPLTPKGCRSWYSNKKDGPIAASAHSFERCEKVNANIRKNLEAAGYKCEAVENASVQNKN